MTDMFDNITTDMAIAIMSLPNATPDDEITDAATRSVLRALLDLPEDIIAAGMNACLDDGVNFVIPKDVTIPFYAVIHAILGDDDETG